MCHELSLEIHLSCLETSQPKNKILCYLQFFCGANTCTIMHSVKLRTSVYVLCPLRIPKERSKVKEILFSSLILFCLVSIVLLRSFCGPNLCYLNVLNNTTTISNDLLFFSLQFVIMPKAGGLQTAGVLCILGLDVNSGYQKCGDVDWPSDQIFLMKDIGGCQTIVKCRSLSDLHSWEGRPPFSFFVVNGFLCSCCFSALF